MKKYYKAIKYLLILLITSAAFTSCIKDDVEPLGDRGTIKVRLSEAPENIIYLSPFNGNKIVDLATVIRDEVSNSGVEQSYTIKIENINDSIDAYNDANETSYDPIPDSIYTLVTGKGVESNGDGTYTVTFAPGVTNVPISISINGNKWDLTKSYAFYFKITDSQGREVAVGKDELLAVVAVKNKYDGVYEITGTCVDASGAYKGDYGDPEAPRQYELLTTGLQTGLFYDRSWGFENYIVVNIETGGGANTGIRPLLTFDPETDKIVGFSNYNNPAQAISEFSGQYDESSKTITLHWVIGRWNVTEEWTYIGER